MRTASELPPGLAPWSASLDFLTVDAALHIGPLVRRIDGLVRRHDAIARGSGEPDGYGGLTTVGHPEQMLLSEWLLADELPDEFVRRAATRELLYLAPVRRAPSAPGRVAVLFDVGVDQLGACRLVQLAALVVLHRRSVARGSELAITTTADEPGEWHVGELPDLFATWRAKRCVDPASDMSARRTGLDAPDELWVLAGDELAGACPSLPLLLRISEVDWDADGVTQVALRFDGRTTTLALPSGPIAVRALRGAALRRRPARGPLRASVAGFGWPSFTSADRCLLLRGATSEELVTLRIPSNPDAAACPRSHRFPGTVVAVGSLGKRVGVLVNVGDSVEFHVIGKRLTRLEGLRFPAADLPDTALGDGELQPLFYNRGDLLCRLGPSWWHLSRDRPPVPVPDVVAVGSGRQLDIPMSIAVTENVLRDVDPWTELATNVQRDTLKIVCGRRAVAWSTGEKWHVRGHDLSPMAIAIPAGEDVIGLAAGGLITRSDAGAILRLRTESAVRTLTQCSGIAVAHSVHPAVAMIAIQRDETNVEVRDVLRAVL